MSAMADLHTALEDLQSGHVLDAEQARLVADYADYLRAPVDTADLSDQ